MQSSKQPEDKEPKVAVEGKQEQQEQKKEEKQKPFPQPADIAAAIKALKEEKRTPLPPDEYYSLIPSKTEAGEQGYFIIKTDHIGEGNAKIYLGFQVDTNGNKMGEEIVLKAITKGGMIEKKEIEKAIENEVNALQQIHPSSYQCADSEYYYIAQPFIKGKELMSPGKNKKTGKDELQLLDWVAKLPLLQRFELIEAMYENLEKIHSPRNGMRFIHGDIKGQNIMAFFNEEKKKIEVSIMDFGTAVSVKDNDIEIPRTKDVVGSPLHLDPLNVDFRCIDFTSDVFALTGVTASILGAENPFLEKENNQDPKKDPDRKRVSTELDKIFNQKIEAVRIEYESKIKSSIDPIKKEELIAERIEKIRELNTQKNQMFKSLLQEKIKKGETLKEFRNVKLEEVERGYSYKGLGRNIGLEPEDSYLIKFFLLKNEQVYENKEDYRNKRPSASQSKLFFACMRYLYEAKLSPEQKIEMRGFIKNITKFPKLKDHSYNMFFQIIKRDGEPQEKIELLQNKLKEFAPVNEFSLVNRVKNLSRELFKIISIISADKGNLNLQSIEGIKDLKKNIIDSHPQFFDDKRDAVAFVEHLDKMIVKLTCNKYIVLGQTAGERRQDTLNSLQKYMSELNNQYAEKFKLTQVKGKEEEPVATYRRRI